MKFNAITSTMATALTLLVAAPAFAGTVAPGFASIVALGPNDDSATGAIALGFTANYFGNSYANTFISNNGYLTFNNPQGTYTPGGLGAGYTGQPIIAAFFGDVWTYNPGATTNYGYGTYNGHAAFGATWDNVSYYSDSSGDKTNTFQILLTDRSDTGAGNFDIYYNYNQIEWETGNASGGANGLGGTSAAVGFNAGTGNAPGTFYELAGSRTPGTFLDDGTAPLVNTTNDGVPGQLLFQVRNGGVVVPPVGEVPEPASWAMMLGGFGMIGGALRRRQRTSVSFA